MAKSSSDKTPLPLIRDFGNIAALVWEGQVFNTCNPVLGTGITGQTSLALTLSTVQLRNLGSKAMVPLWARFVQVGSIANARIHVVSYAYDNDQYTSGTALEINCTNRQKASASQVQGAHTATIPALTVGNAVEMSSGEIFKSVTTVNTGDFHELLEAPGAFVINPGGAWSIYTWCGTTGPTWLFNIGWAEIEV